MSDLAPAGTNELLGFSPDARLLILNDDDFGMYHAVNTAVVRSISEGIASSCSLMVTCPWALHAMRLLRDNPEIDFGVHLTLVCDTTDYRWGPLTPRQRVRSLLDDRGNLFDDTQLDELMTRARLDEVELEFRAQIDAVLAAGLEPSHLGRPHSGAGRRVRAGWRICGAAGRERARERGLPANDHDLVDNFDIEPERKQASFERMLRELPPGLSEWAVHPGFGNEEAKAIDPGGWLVRSSDLEFLTSPAARRIVEDEGIVVLDYARLRAAWRR